MEEHFLVLKRGQQVAGEIIAFCRKKKISSAYFSAIGAVSSAEIAFYDINAKKYSFKTFSEDLEICSMAGNVAVMKGELVLHAHAAFSDRKMETKGGHLKDAVVSGTCEVFLVPLKERLEREFDEGTGLNLIT